jgi:transcriptional regulator with XRE-family HTH domain
MTPLCRLRRFLGLTQADVETATGISVRRLSLAEHGSVKLTDSEECAVSEYLADRLRIVRELPANTRETSENRTEHVDGVRHSWFRLVNSPAPRTPESPKFDVAVRS